MIIAEDLSIASASFIRLLTMTMNMVSKGSIYMEGEWVENGVGIY